MSGRGTKDLPVDVVSKVHLVPDDSLKGTPPAGSPLAALSVAERRRLASLQDVVMKDLRSSPDRVAAFLRDPRAYVRKVAPAEEQLVRRVGAIRTADARASRDLPGVTLKRLDFDAAPAAVQRSTARAARRVSEDIDTDLPSQTSPPSGVRPRPQIPPTRPQPLPNVPALELGGFDCLLGLSAAALRRTLVSLLETPLRQAVTDVPIPLLNAPSASFSTTMAFTPQAEIDSAAQQIVLHLDAQVHLELPFNAESAVELPLVGGPEVLAAIRSVPVDLGPIAATVTLPIGIARPADDKVLELRAGTITVSLPGLDATVVSNTIQSQVQQQIQALGETVDLASLTSLAGQLSNSLASEIGQRLVQRLGAPLAPLTRPFTLVGAGNCGIGLQDVRVGFLSGDVPALAFGTKLLTTSAPGTLTAVPSPLKQGEEVGVLFDNFFLLSALCCMIRRLPQFSSLPAPTTSGRNEFPLCCRWNNIDVVTRLEGRDFRIKRLSVCIQSAETGSTDKEIAVSADLTTEGFGWTAQVSFRSAVTLGIKEGTLAPVVEAPQVTVEIHLAWWLVLGAVALGVLVGVIIGAVVGAILGLLYAAITAVIGAATSAAAAAGIGAAIGAGILAAVMAVVTIGIIGELSKVLNDGVFGAVTAGVSGAFGTLEALQILPKEILSLFPIEPVTVQFDDLRIGGRLSPPGAAPGTSGPLRPIEPDDIKPIWKPSTPRPLTEQLDLQLDDVVKGRRPPRMPEGPDLPRRR